MYVITGYVGWVVVLLMVCDLWCFMCWCFVVVCFLRWVVGGFVNFAALAL